MQSDVVKVSGRGNNVDFAIHDTLPFEQVVSGLRQYLADNRRLLSKGTITVNAGLRMGSREQLSELRRVIEQESGLQITSFWCSPDTVGRADPARPAISQPRPANPPLREDAPDPLAARENGAVSVKALPGLNGASDEPDAPTTPLPTALAPPWTVNSARKTRARLAATPEFLVRNAEAAATPEFLVRSAGAATTAEETDAPGPEVRGFTDAAQPEPGSGPDDPVVGPSPMPHANGTQPAAVGLEPDGSLWASRRDTALLVKATCHSGELIRHDGDVVILGDVNPGAEIVAGGDITVFGALRGHAHAGSGGLSQAAIIAYRLASPRLQIGPYVSVASQPKGARRKGGGAKSSGTAPMIAYVRRQSIYVAAFTGRYAKYNRGIPYEG